MKLLFILLLFPFEAYSQFFTDSISVNENGIVTYEEVVEQSGTKDQLYTKAKLWIADNFKSAKNVIQTDDKEEGLIVIKALFNYSYQHYFTSTKKKRKEVETQTLDYPENRNANFTMKIFLKDNKYKFLITDIELEETVGRLVFSNYTWSQKHLTGMKEADTSILEIKVWQLDQLSEKRSINKAIINTMSSIKAYMSKKAENEF
jgi:hypothetical protein